MKLCRGGRIEGGPGQRIHDQIEERFEIFAGLFQVAGRGAGASVGINHGKIELLLGGIEIDEKIIDFVQDSGDAGVGSVDFVDADNRRQLGLERFFENEPCLRQRPLRSIHEQHHAIDHCEGALDLAAEVRMAGRIDDVDLHIAVMDRGVLRHDRDAAFAFEIHRIHHPIGNLLVSAKNSALAQHAIDQSGFAVIDVRDDGDVAQRMAPLERGGGHHSWLLGSSAALSSDARAYGPSATVCCDRQGRRVF